MTYLQILYQTRDNIQKLIDREETKKRTSHSEYEQRKARGQCTAAASCKNKLVPQHRMCSYHLHRAARASEKRHQKDRYSSISK